jgi:hypothetical protein
VCFYQDRPRKRHPTNLERAEQTLVNAHHGTGIVKLSAVVGRAEQGYQLSLGEELVAIFDDLMSTTNQVHVVLLQESRDNVRSKGERDTAVVLTPASNVLVRVRPEQIAKQPTVRNLCTLASWHGKTAGQMDKKTGIAGNSVTYISGSHDASNLLHGVQVRAEATVHGENLLVDDSGNGKAVEAVGEGLPQLDVVAALALIIETVDTVDRGTLMVASQDEEVLGVLDLVGEQEADGLKRLLASIYIVAEEEVVGLGREATVFKKPQQIIVLAVDVAANLPKQSAFHSCQDQKHPMETYLDGSLQLEQDGLGDEDLASFGAQVSDLGFEQLDLLSRTAASHLEQAVDYRIEVDLVLVSHSRGIPWRGIARRYRGGGRRWRVENESTGCRPMRGTWRLRGSRAI